MIRTLHVIGSRIGGGAESFLMRLARALQARGHPAHVAARPGSPVLDGLVGEVPTTPVAMRNGIDVLSTRKIARLADSAGADIVQSYMGRATRLTRIRSGRAVHVARLGNYYRLRSYRHCDAWIGNTRGICDYLVGAGFPPERVFHIYNFVDLPVLATPAELDALRARHRIPEDALVVASPGRFAPVKGFDVLLRAFARIAPSVGDRHVILVLVGDGPAAGELRTLAGELELADRIRWTGWVPDVGPFYDLADLVVFPPRREEPFGNVVLETWAHGAPLVTTRFRGAEEFVRPGEDAIVVDCEDPVALAEAMEDALVDETGRREIGAAGLARVRADFNVERIVDEYLAVYEGLQRRAFRTRPGSTPTA